MTGPECTLAGCERPYYGRGYCRPHYMRWKRHGDPQAGVPIGRKMPGGMNYWSALRRVRAQRGPASAQRCAECGAPAVTWSYAGTDPGERTEPTHGYRYSLDSDRYVPRCRSCQRRAMDCGPRAPVLPQEAAERAARLYRAGASVRGIAALLTAPRTAVVRALRAHGVALRAPGRRR